MKIRTSVIALALVSGAVIAADDNRTPVERGEYGPLDQYPGNPLYSAPIQVSEHVYSAIGATQPATFENHGHNNNLSFIIGDASVMVINGGSNDELAAALHAHIRALTDLPVDYVVSENGQRHAVTGNHYWHQQGATLIGQTDAQHEIEDRAGDYIATTRRARQDENYAVHIVDFDQTVDEALTVDLGGLAVELRVFGPAHSPGDMAVIVPADQVVLAGDLAFHVRMPPIFDETDSAGWVDTFRSFQAFAGDMIIVPGHGGPTDMATVTAGTLDYLLYLREQAQILLDEGGSLDDAYKIDQRQYAHWHTYAELAARNAGRVFTQMEFE